MAEFTEDWFSKNISVWEKALAHLKGKPITAIELGSYEGRSSVWLLENILTDPLSTLDCVDTWEGGVEHSDIDMKAVEERFDKNIEPFVKQVTKWKTDTTTYLQHYSTMADLIYIDASHQAKDVLTDAVLSHMRLKSGGIIIFDDYLWGGLANAPNLPKPAINAFMECFADEYDALFLGYQVILRKKDGQN